MTSSPEPANQGHVSPDEIAVRVKAYVAEALKTLPAEYAERLVNVQFFVRQMLSREEGARKGIDPRRLYGLYEGVPLTRRSSGYNLVTPDRITIFWGPIVRDFPKPEALAEQVQKVVLHEIGHYFGMSEADLSQTRMH